MRFFRNILRVFWWMLPVQVRGCSAGMRRPAGSGAFQLSASVQGGRMRFSTVLRGCSLREAGWCIPPARLRRRRMRGASEGFCTGIRSFRLCRQNAFRACLPACRSGFRCFRRGWKMICRSSGRFRRRRDGRARYAVGLRRRAVPRARL